MTAEKKSTHHGALIKNRAIRPGPGLSGPSRPKPALGPLCPPIAPCPPPAAAPLALSAGGAFGRHPVHRELSRVEVCSAVDKTRRLRPQRTKCCEGGQKKLKVLVYDKVGVFLRLQLLFHGSHPFCRTDIEAQIGCQGVVDRHVNCCGIRGHPPIHKNVRRPLWSIDLNFVCNTQACCCEKPNGMLHG